MIKQVELAGASIDLYADKTIDIREQPPGPPKRIDGISIGIVSMSQSAPHGGEVHYDGDELLYIISGRVVVHGDSAPDQPLMLGPGQSCLVPQGEWHRVEVLEPTQLMHITPGPNGDHRPLSST